MDLKNQLILAEDDSTKLFTASIVPSANDPMYCVIDEWIETFFKHEDLADSTKALYEGTYKLYFRDSEIAALPLKEVTPHVLQYYFNNCGLKVSSMKGIYKLLRHFYRHCCLTGMCNDAVAPVKIPRNRTRAFIQTKRYVEVWDDVDLQKLIDSLYGTKLRFLVVLAVNTGARFSELLALNYEDIQDNCLIINKQLTEVAYDGVTGARLCETKTPSSNRVIALSERVLEEFEIHKKLHKAEMLRKSYTTDYIFSTEVGTYHFKTTIRKQLEAIYNAIGVPHHKFHSFRHTFGTNLSRAGVPIEYTAKLMGHSDIDVTERYYLNMGKEEQLNAVEKIVKYSFGE